MTNKRSYSRPLCNKSVFEPSQAFSLDPSTVSIKKYNSGKPKWVLKNGGDGEWAKDWARGQSWTQTGALDPQCCHISAVLSAWVKPHVPSPPSLLLLCSAALSWSRVIIGKSSLIEFDIAGTNFRWLWETDSSLWSLAAIWVVLRLRCVFESEPAGLMSITFCL